MISTGKLGKDAKGFINKWEKKPKKEAEILSFYTPDKLIEAFINSKLIINKVQYILSWSRNWA